MSVLTTTPLALWAATPAFFFAGLALASIPIIIHILNRRRYKVVRWAAMEYLLQAMRKNRRRLKFEQLLLLITRCAVLVLLGLALARPQGCSNSSVAALTGQRSALHIFIIDNSYPMAYEAARPNATTHLGQAKFLVQQQIDRLTKGSESVAIILASRQPRIPANGKNGDAKPDPVILHPTFRLDAATATIQGIEQSYDGADLAGALQAAERLARDEQKQQEKFLYIYSDFTRRAWETPDAEIIRQTGKQLADTFGARHIRIHNLGVANQCNYAATDIRPDGPIARAKLDSDFLADIRGFGGGQGTKLQWGWDRQILPGGGFIKPEPNTPPQRQRKADLSSGGIHVLSTTLLDNPDDHLSPDNTRNRVIEIASELKVLIVEGSRDTGSVSLQLMLAPKTEVSSSGAMRSDSYVAPEQINESDFGTKNKRLVEYRALILSNVGAVMTDNQLDEIRSFVAGGGTLMLFMGEHDSRDFCNRLYDRQLLPGKMLMVRAAPAGGGFTLDFRPNSTTLHPLLGAFKNQEQTGLDKAQIEKYCQIELDPKLQPDTVLRYLDQEKETNDPAIVVHPLGSGRVVTVTTTATSDWNMLPMRPNYPALIHELLSGTIDVGDRWMNVTVGDCLQVPAAMELTAMPTLMDPNSKPIRMFGTQAPDGTTHYRSEPLKTPGVYRLQYQSKQGDDIRPIAVNVPADQADTTVLPAEAIKKGLGDVDVQLFGDAVPSGALSRDDRADLGWFVMLLVLVLVAAECFMAMHFGHYRRKVAIPAPVAVEPNAAPAAQTEARHASPSVQ